MGKLATDSHSFMLTTAATFVDDAEQPIVRQADILSRDLNLGLGAIATILVADKDTGLAIVGAHGMLGVDRALCTALSDWRDIAHNLFFRNSCRWLRSTMNERPVDFLVATLKPAESDEIFVVSLFDPPIDDAVKGEIEKRFAQRRRLAISYLEMSKFDRALRLREAALEKALSTMRTGVVLLDSQANVVFSNDVACAMFRAADCLKLHRGRLLATNLRDNVRLTVALQHAAALGDAEEPDQRAPMLALERSDHTSLIVLVLPLRTAEGVHGDAISVLHIVDPKLDFAEHVRPLCHIYRLSRSETDLACLLAKGLTLAHAADVLRLKEQTARSILRSIFYKTGTGRQTELVLLLLSHMVQTSSPLTIDAF